MNGTSIAGPLDGKQADAEEEDGHVRNDSEEVHLKVTQPHARKRVSRACQACRRRKIKCDGKEPCQGCISAELSCVFQGAMPDKIPKEQSEILHSRIRGLEGILQAMSARLDEQQKSMEAMAKKLERFDSLPSSDCRVAVETENADGDHRDANHTATAALPCKRRRPDRETGVLSGDVGGDSKRCRHSQTGSLPPTHADAYGELRRDEGGHLRYLGLGSALRMIDVCPPFRRHLDQGLEKKGCGNWNAVFVHPLDSRGSPFADHASDAEELPPTLLTSLLVEWYYERLHYIYPIISRADFQSQMTRLTMRMGAQGTEKHDGGCPDFLAAFYGVLAMAALSMPSSHIASIQSQSLQGWKDVQLAPVFFQRSVACNRSYPAQGHGGLSRSLNQVMALVLQAAYLASIGNQAEAWITVGQAARLGQDMGLHRSPAQLDLPKPDQEARRHAWWCIYSLDRAISSALGRPFAIRDVDCDMELPQGLPGEAKSGFLAILQLRQILGNIVDTVAAVRRVKDNRCVGRIPEMRAAVVELHAQLQAWSATEVPQHIKCAQTGSANVERLIALSSYLSALMLLYRYLVPNPHRTSPLRGSEAVARCARAASGCIRITGQVLESLPVCADLVFHAQHVFAAAMILLHCIRRSDDARFIQSVLRDVELAQRYLHRLQDSWVGGAATSNFTGFLEEYLELILSCLERGLGSHQCAFHHDEHELTGLEWRDETESCFASDWSQIGSVAAISPAVTVGTAVSANSSGHAMHPGTRSFMSDIWNFSMPPGPASNGLGGQWTLGAMEQDLDQALDVTLDTGFNFGL